MSSNVGENLKISIFGESHGKGIGVVADGLPAGEKIDLNILEKFMDRRAPGKNKFGTKRNEGDTVEFLSGIVDNIITGSPLAGVIYNKDQRSKDYSNLEKCPRPSHADYTAFKKYKGFADMRGGGHFSGRLTAPLCIIGGIAKQILEKKGIFVGAHLLSVGNIKDSEYDFVNLTEQELKLTDNNEFPMINRDSSEKAQKLLEEIRMEEDSIGGIIQCGAMGVPIGLGNPIYDGIENNLAKAIFGIPGVKGLVFGLGFEGTKIKGSSHNDCFYVKDGEVKTKTNNNGGINGGITNGMPIIINVAMKPTPSISKEQSTINLATDENSNIIIKGRHDPCIAIRAVPVVEAVMAIVILDYILGDK